MTRDYDDHQHQSYTNRPPRPPPFSAAMHRAEPTLNLPQQVPNSTPLAQSTPRSVIQIPPSTTTSATVTPLDTQRSRQSQYQPISATTSQRSFPYPSQNGSARPKSHQFAETPSTALSHLPPSIPPRVQRTPKASPTIEQEVPLSAAKNRRPPPPPPIPVATPLKKRSSRSNSVVAPRPSIVTTPKSKPKKEEQLLQRSSSADRVGRERWLHHITDSSAMNTGESSPRPSPSRLSPFSAIKLRTSLPNPLQLVSNHFNAMSKFLHATKYAIEHRDEETVRLFQVRDESCC